MCNIQVLNKYLYYVFVCLVDGCLMDEHGVYIYRSLDFFMNVHPL